MTPEIRNTPLKMTGRGYLRQLGLSGSKSGSKQKFYLGYDLAKAAQSREWLEKIYIENCHLMGNENWSDMFLDIAQQTCKSRRAVVRIEKLPPEASHFGPGDYSFVERLRAQGVPIDIVGQATAKLTLPESVTPQNKPAITKLHAAIEKYRDERCEKYVGLFQGKKRLEKQINAFLSLPNMWIYQLDVTAIEDYVNHWRSRPVTKHGKQCSAAYAENQIGEFLTFATWLSRRFPSEFSKPDVTGINRKVNKIARDKPSNSIRQVFWDVDDLRIVFQNAQPLTKLIIGLGLNCCAGSAELGRFKVEDFQFDCVHPKAKQIRFTLSASWLMTIRRKAFTHSESLLWNWVVELVKEQVDVCRKKGWVYLFTENGEPLYRDNEMYKELGLDLPNTEKPESRFTGRFNNAVRHVEKQIKNPLSIGKLRKTFSNYLTNENHADLGSLALSHATDADKQLKHYADKPYARLFKATLDAESYWDLTKKPDPKVDE